MTAPKHGVSDKATDIPTSDIRRAFNNYTWEAWSDGVMRSTPLIDRWALLCLDLEARGQQVVPRGDMDSELADEVDRWKGRAREL